MLTEEEIAVLRSTGALVRNFAGHARAGDAKEMARTVAVIQEHRPAEPILDRSCMNRRGSFLVRDVQRAFLRGLEQVRPFDAVTQIVDNWYLGH
ncbi:hypothetical protein [Burkholderia vietnamiensis]|uniref:hypothetical protein n=1 Tax=Burkholderia vietnamiensis TaxID=60552 RepID=UPI0012D9FEC6|nr:hypothetical protein [Burkholderia vietnamiensis]